MKVRKAVFHAAGLGTRLTPGLFPILADTAPDSRGKIQLTDGLRTLRGRRPIYAVEFGGRRHNAGEKLGFLKATVEFALCAPRPGRRGPSLPAESESGSPGFRKRLRRRRFTIRHRA